MTINDEYCWMHVPGGWTCQECTTEERTHLMPNLAILLGTLGTICLLAYYSSESNKEASRQEIKEMENPPKHAILDNHVSGNVVAICVLIAIVGTLLAMASGH